jgi:hypothetical protein
MSESVSANIGNVSPSKSTSDTDDATYGGSGVLAMAEEEPVWRPRVRVMTTQQSGKSAGAPLASVEATAQGYTPSASGAAMEYTPAASLPAPPPPTREQLLETLHKRRAAARAGVPYTTEEMFRQRAEALSEKLAKAATGSRALKPNQEAAFQRLQAQLIAADGDVSKVLSQYSIPDQYKVAIMEQQKNIMSGEKRIDEAVKETAMGVATTKLYESIAQGKKKLGRS